MNNVFDELFDEEFIYTRYKFIRVVYNYLESYYVHKKLYYSGTYYNLKEFLSDVKYSINNGKELSEWQRKFITNLINRYNYKIEQQYYNTLALAC